MSDFELILEECLDALESGTSNVDACLGRYPEHARRLRPILLTAERFESGLMPNPSPVVKVRVRSGLIRQMQAHPRKRMGFNFTFMRLATGLALIVLALLAAGTAYAQSALPGEPLHGWKLISEDLWRFLSPDRVGTDIFIAERRLDELLAVSDNPSLRIVALDAYLEASARLRTEMDAENEARILPVLESQAEKLINSDVPVSPAIDQDLPAPTLEVPAPTLEVPTSLPEVIPGVTVPVPTLEPPRLLPTDVRKIVPTVLVPPLIP
jgi:hypothetical protein